jgi:isopentenyl diphosphate isomerase/L-lactate dehydrogenase-like FMN-dependent dehydrogenase
MGIDDAGQARNVFDLEIAARERLGGDAYLYLAEGADDNLTVQANREAFREYRIRARRLIDVSRVDTSLELFGERLESPILLAPVGFQAVFHPEAELATARAAASRGHRMIVSSVSTFSVTEVVEAGGRKVWFQLYATPNREVTLGLLQRAESAGCSVVILTVDTPVIGNREQHAATLEEALAGERGRMGNFEGLPEFESITDAGMTWEVVGWLKRNSKMKVVLKGIVTSEDAELCLRHDVDGIIVSNHGGRQLDSEMGTLSCLVQVVDAVDGRIPVLIDGGFRRGTDILKALALGADAVCIGRPYCWGLGAFGESGVARALELLQLELVRDMQIAGAPSLTRLDRSFLAGV